MTIEREEEPALEGVEVGERRLEGERQQEAGQQLDAGLHDAQLLELVLPLAVEPLLVGLVAAVVLRSCIRQPSETGRSCGLHLIGCVARRVADGRLEDGRSPDVRPD